MKCSKCLLKVYALYDGGLCKQCFDELHILELDSEQVLTTAQGGILPKPLQKEAVNARKMRAKSLSVKRSIAKRNIGHVRHDFW